MRTILDNIRRGSRPATAPQASPLASEVETAPLAACVGHIDKVNAGTIVGWAAILASLQHPAKVRLYLDDVLCAEGKAFRARQDVAAAGFGDGNHGFELPVPKKALMCAERLTLAVCADDNSELVCDILELRKPVSRRGPVLYMDASDLIEFLTHHRELSGIQRVQAGFLLGLGNAKIAGTQCRICTRFRSSSFYFEVPYQGFVSILGAAGDRSNVSDDAWTAYVMAFTESLTSRANLTAGDTIFTMGAPWALDDHNETVRCAKQFYGARYLQIFYDLIPISMPEVVPAPLVPPFARAMAAMAVYADHIFSISRHSQDDLTTTLAKLERNVPSISVIPMGGSITDAEAASAISAGALAKLGVEGPFVLCVGTLEPRKNHMLLFHVWRRLVAKHGPDNVPKLVLVGRVGWYMEDFMRMMKITCFVEQTVIHLQGVSNGELSELYKKCMFTIFPSFSEGWGLPITESLALGKVCVCSNSTSMPEAGGPHALYIDPFDTSAAYDLCETLIYDGRTLAAEEAKLRATFKAPTWAEASEGLRQQFVDLVPRLSKLPTTPRKPIELGRTYKFHNIESASSNATATDVFRNFLDQEDALELLHGWNWFPLDVNCTWACGPEGSLCLSLPEEGAGFVAYLGLVIPPCYDDIHCDVSVDGVWRGRFNARGGVWNISIVLPKLSSSETKLSFRFKGERLNSADGRLLGVGIGNVTVFAEDDFRGRLLYIENEPWQRF